MIRKPIASIIALVFAAFVLLFQFVRASVISGELVMQSQLSLHVGESASLLTIIETVLAFLIPLSLVILCGLLVYQECRKEPVFDRIEFFLKLMIIPVVIMFISALQKTLYIYLYEGSFSIEFTWPTLLTSIVISAVYALTVFDKVKSGYWLIVTCLIFIIVDVLSLCFPGFPYAYVIGNNVYISMFISSVSFYFAYLFLGMSFVLYHRRSV